jgi:hypothetical protein
MGLDKFLSGLPVFGGLFDNSDEKAAEQLAKNAALYKGLNLPTFKDYKPEAYNPNEAKANLIQEDPSLRSAQMNVLSRMAGLADTGLSDVDNAGFERARELGNQMEHSNTAAALQNAQARGIGGSGLEFALREMGNQAGAERAQGAGVQQASQAAQQRALYNQAYGNALGGMRQQDLGANSANANILNDFNKLNTQNRNQAQLYNVGQNNYAQQYGNQMAQQNFQNQLSKVGGQAGANKEVAQGYYNQGAANQQNRNGMLNAGIGVAGLAGAFDKKKPDEESESEGY